MAELEKIYESNFAQDTDPTRYIETFLAHFNEGIKGKWKEDVERLKGWIYAVGKNPLARKEVVLESIVAYLETYTSPHQSPKEWEAESKPALEWLKREITNYQQTNS